MSRPRKDRVGIFWDFQNLGVADPSWVDGRSVVGRIRSVARRFGVINVFKAYVDVGSIAHLAESRSELQTSGVSLVDCPQDGVNNVVETTMIVDMMVFPMDCSTPVTIVLISNNNRFAYAMSVLRMRHQDVVVISKNAHSVPLQYVASRIIDWERDILGRDTSDSLSIQPGRPLDAMERTVASNDLEPNTASGRPDSYCDRLATEHPIVVVERPHETVVAVAPQEVNEILNLESTDEVKKMDRLHDHAVDLLTPAGPSLATAGEGKDHAEPESTRAPSWVSVGTMEASTHHGSAIEKEAGIVMLKGELKGDVGVQPTGPAYRSESQVQAASSLDQELSPPSTSVAAPRPETTASNGRQNEGALTGPGPVGSHVDLLHNAGSTLLSVDCHYRPFVEFLEKRRMSGTLQLTWEQAKELFWNGAIRDEVCRTFANYVVRCSEAGLIDITVERDSNAAAGTKACIELRAPWRGVLSRTGSPSEYMLSPTSRIGETKTVSPVAPKLDHESFKGEGPSPVIGISPSPGVANPENCDVVAHGLSPEPRHGDFSPRVVITMVSDDCGNSVLLDRVVNLSALRPSTEEQTRAADAVSLSTGVKPMSTVSPNSNDGGSGEARTAGCDGPSTASYTSSTSAQGLQTITYKEKQEDNQGEGIGLGGGVVSLQPSSDTKSWSSISPRYRPLVAYLERKRLSGAQEVCFPQIAEEFWTGATRSRVATGGRLERYIEECHQAGIVARSFRIDPGDRDAKKKQKYISLRDEWHGIFSGDVWESFNATDSNGRWSYPDTDIHLGEPVRMGMSFMHSRYLPLVEYLKHQHESGIVEVSWDEATKALWTGVLREQIGGQFGRYVKDCSEAGFVDIVVYKKGTKKKKHKKTYIALRSFRDGAMSCSPEACPSSEVRATDDKACTGRAAGVQANAITGTDQESGSILDTRTLSSGQATVAPMRDRPSVPSPPSLEQDCLKDLSSAGSTQEDSDASTPPQSKHPMVPLSPAKSEAALSDASGDSYETATSSMFYEDTGEESASAKNDSTTGDKDSELSDRSSLKVTLDSPPCQDDVRVVSSTVEAECTKPESLRQDRHGTPGLPSSCTDTLPNCVASIKRIEQGTCEMATGEPIGEQRISQDASRDPQSSLPVFGRSVSTTTAPIPPPIVWAEGIVDLADLPSELKPPSVRSVVSNSMTASDQSLSSVPLQFRELVVYLEKRRRMGVPQVRRCTINKRVFKRNPQIPASRTLKQYIARAVELGFVTRTKMNGKKGQCIELGAKWRGLALPGDKPSSSTYRSNEAATTANANPGRLDKPTDKQAQGATSSHVTTEDSTSSHPTSARSSVASQPSKHSTVWSEGLEDLAELPLGYRPPSDIPVTVPRKNLSSVPLEYRPLVIFLEEERRTGRPEVGWASVNTNVWVKPRKPPAGGKFQRYVERAAAQGLVTIRGMSEPKPARAIALQAEWHGVSTT